MAITLKKAKKEFRVNDEIGTMGYFILMTAPLIYFFRDSDIISNMYFKRLRIVENMHNANANKPQKFCVSKNHVIKNAQL